MGAVRIIKKNDAWTINPSYKEREDADIELIVSGKDGKINMIEAGAKEVSDDDIVLGLTKAVEEIARSEEFQKDRQGNRKRKRLQSRFRKHRKK